MLFNSVHFLFFLPVVAVLYYVIPHRYRMWWLLITSYYFYMSWNPVYVLLIVASTITTYLAGIFIENIRKRGYLPIYKKYVIAGSITVNLGILFFYKYFNFLNDTVRNVLSGYGITYEVSNLDFLLPVGISFYTFQVIGYIIDVYRGTVNAERSLVKYALFVAFFPPLIAGPIERASNLLPQLAHNRSFNYEAMREGLLMFLWGLFQKVMIADRLAIVVNTVYNDVEQYKGFQLIIATVLFSFQILCDFSAYSDMAIGASKILGIDLMKNFERPYFAKSVREFWRRWHISLSTWFKDYLYFPLGGSKNGRWKTYRNIMIVFIVSGVWHGANWTFLIWGILHGVFQIAGIIFQPYSEKLSGLTGLQKDALSHKLVNVCITFCLVSFAWIFFRANSVADAFYIVSNIFVFNPETLLIPNLVQLGMEESELWLICSLVILLLIVHMLQRNGRAKEELQNLWLPIRWSVYLAAIVLILIYGIYGSQYEAAQFIYFQF